MPRFSSYPQSSPRSHYTGRWATTPRYELRHSPSFKDLIRFVCPLPLSVGTIFFYKKKGSTPRPQNTQLSLQETEGLGVEGGLMTGGFEEWWEEYLQHKTG